jgi:CubicO group peptidase (beta-lactamase class C family)
MKAALAQRLERAIDEKIFPGCVVGIVQKNGERTIFPFGNFTYESDSPSVTENTVYDLASVTKSIPFASLALTFIDTGRLNLPDKVRDYLPELQNDYDATIEDLLRYRVHGIQLSKLRLKTFEEIRTHALERGFDGPPGESVYTNLPAFLLGTIVERIGGASLATLAHKHFFESLKMDHTTFFPSVSDCAPTEINERGVVQGFPHDESAYVFAKARRTVGHAGLFSTAPDLLNFLEALLNVGHRMSYISAGASKELGWQIDGAFLGANSAGRFGKTGFTGTSVVVDAERGVALVILSNRTWPKRPADSGAIHAFRGDIADIVFNS